MISVENQPTVNPYIGSFGLILVICFFIWHLWNKRPTNSPPGSNGVPLLGILLSLRAFPERVMQNWSKLYGSLYMVKFGPTNVVVIGCPDVAYEAFVKHDCFNDRPQSIPVMSDGGIIMTNSSDFQREQRRFSLNVLREFGMGRRTLEPRIVEVSHEFCSKIDALCSDQGVSEPFYINDMTYQSVSSVISQIIFNDDVGKKNEKFQRLIIEMTTPKKENVLSGVLMFAPMLRFLPYFSYIWRESINYKDKMHDEIKEEITFHQQTRNKEYPRDFIDCFLNEMEKSHPSTPVETDCNRNGKNGFRFSRKSESLNDGNDDDEYSTDWKSRSSFFTEQLIATVRDLFMAGTETTASSICWILLFMCRYPAVQKKMIDEIDEVVGQSGVARMSLLEKLPYVRAVIQEVSRMRPAVPLSVPHMASRDATLMGYHIPKGAIILTNIWGIQNDESRWPEPERFLPERHLDKDGKFIKSSDWMIFNVGLRSCLGQQLAKMELFIATVSLFQKFSMSLPPGTIPNMDGESLVTLRPRHFKVIATRR